MRTVPRLLRALAGAIVAVLALGVAVPAADAGNRPSSPKPTVVLVHGAFADASSWNPVVARLQRLGYPVLVPANPLRGLSGDSHYLASVLATIDGPVILVGHSYGGAVISNAAVGNENVRALVFIAAFALDEGESLASISTQFPDSDLGAAILPRPTPDGTDLYIRPDVFRPVFAADLPRAATDVMAATQRPLADLGFGELSGPPAWATIPSWYMVAANDRAIDPAAERFMAQRAGAHTTVERSSHVAMLSHPDDVVRMIVDAARTTG